MHGNGTQASCQSTLAQQGSLSSQCVRPASRPEPFHWHVQNALGQPWDVNIPVFLPNVLGRLT